MNIKLHTPKSLKAGSGMGSMKQFLLSILATTVSIALTFGTAAIVDHNKKEKEKHEIVMMVLYDMYNSLKSVEKVDSMLIEAMSIQRKLVEDTSLFNSMRFKLAMLVPRVNFPETTERIFSSNIESINTVGNVLFNENVAKFYMLRQQYKVEVCDSLWKEIQSTPFKNLKGSLYFDFLTYAFISLEYGYYMKRLFVECRKLMGITDEEIEIYRKNREQMENSMPDDQEEKDSIGNELLMIDRELIEKRKILFSE